MPLSDDTSTAFSDIIRDHGQSISQNLSILRSKHFAPDEKKGLRLFSVAEVAHFLNLTPSRIKKLHMNGEGPSPTLLGNGKRFYSAEQILELRQYLAENGRRKNNDYLPYRRENEKLQVMSVINFKGGSGKTTTAAHLAQHLALTGHRVLAIDLDPQASMSAMFGIQPEVDDTPSFYEALRYDDEQTDLSKLIYTSNFPNLHLVPANLELQEFEYDTPLALMNGKDGIKQTFHTRIAQALQSVDSQYDVVVIDCPPQLGYLTLTALVASTAVLVTIHPQMLDVMSMGQFLIMLSGILDSIAALGVDVDLNWMRYLMTRYEPTDNPQIQMAGFLQALFPDQMMKNHMVKSTAISDAGITKQTIYEVERGQFTRSTYDRAFEAMWAVNQEVVELLHQTWGRQ